VDISPSWGCQLDALFPTLRGVNQMVDEKPDAGKSGLAWCEYCIKFHCRAKVIRQRLQKPARRRLRGAFDGTILGPPEKPGKGLR
jgi:hypothetical protein